MDFQLSERQEDVRREAAALAATFSLAYWRELDRTSEYPWAFVKAFASNDWLGIIVPEEYGGLGLGVTEAALMLSEVARSGAGTSGASALHFYVFPPGPIVKHGSEEMKRKYLPRLARGELLMAFGITEPNAGTDTSRITTRAEKQPDGRWLINGQKVWTTNAQNAEKILLLTRTSPRNPEHPLDGMTLFFVDLDRTKCRISRIDKLGRSAVDSNEVFIDDLEATDDDIVGEIGRGFHYLLDGLNPERMVVAMEAIGIGRAALGLATQYAKDRVVFDRPIGANQAVAHPLAQNWASLEAAELLALKQPGSTTTGSPAARRPTRPSCSRPKPASRPPTTRCRRTAASVTRRSTTSSDSGGRSGSSS